MLRFVEVLVINVILGEFKTCPSSVDIIGPTRTYSKTQETSYTVYISSARSVQSFFLPVVHQRQICLADILMSSLIQAISLRQILFQFLISSYILKCNYVTKLFVFVIAFFANAFCAFSCYYATVTVRVCLFLVTSPSPAEWRKLHNEELNDLYSLPNIVRVVKSRRMRWTGHVARMGGG
jgi:hypothetical protein